MKKHIVTLALLSHIISAFGQSLSRFYQPGMDFNYVPQVVEFSPMDMEFMYRMAELKKK